MTFWRATTLGNSVVRRDARKKNRKAPKKICFKKKAAHFLKESAPPKLVQFFSRDRRRRDVFYTSLCACRCLRASDRGRAPGHDPSDGRARSVRADRASSHRGSCSLHSMGRPRPRQHMADASSSLDASNNDPPPDTSSRRPTRTHHLPDRGMADERRSLAAGEVRRSEFRLRPG